MRTEDLAKGWLLALLDEAPLHESPAILAADLARDGPRVCDAVVRAIADETDLRRLEPGGALEWLVARVGELSGASDPDGASRAVDALHAVVWSAIRDELRGPDADQIAEIAERLVLVIELVRAAVLRPGGAQRGESGQRSVGGAPAAAGQGFEVVPAAEEPPVAFRPRAASLGAVPPAPPAPEPPEPEPPEPATVAAEPDPPEPATVAPAPADSPLWVRALEDEIRHSEYSGTPLSLLLAELEDADRVAAVEPADEAAATFSRFTQAVRTVARRQDIVVCETETRAWVIARDTARAGAQSLGSRIVAAVSERSPWRGAPMLASVGFAVLGAEGRSADEMIEAAEEARFAASAQGVGLAGATPPPGGPRAV
jgi:GGDEF domain-containing protein